jgi:Ribosomal silencing factor during starvation
VGHCCNFLTHHRLLHPARRHLQPCPPSPSTPAPVTFNPAHLILQPRPPSPLTSPPVTFKPAQCHLQPRPSYPSTPPALTFNPAHCHLQPCPPSPSWAHCGGAQVAQILHDAKTQDVVILDIRNRSVLADFFVVATARSHRHVFAAAHAVKYEVCLGDKEGVGMRRRAWA